MINWKKFKESKFYRKWIYRPYETKSYSSVNEMLSERENHGFLYEIWLDIYYTVKHIWEWPEDRVDDVKYFIQRGIRGWSDRDVWGFDYYLSDVILGGLKKLKKDKHGCPCLEGFGTDSPNDQTDEQFKAMQKEWNRILDTMIFTFEITKKVQDHDLIIPEGQEYFTKAEYQKYKRFCARVNKRGKGKYNFKMNVKIISKKDFLRYWAGWKAFSQYYQSLWD
jgi:hypothetical protein